MNFNPGCWHDRSWPLAPHIPLTLVVFFGGLAYYAAQSPTPVPATAGPELYSAERALGHAPNLAREPRPDGGRLLLLRLSDCAQEAERADHRLGDSPSHGTLRSAAQNSRQAKCGEEPARLNIPPQ